MTTTNLIIIYVVPLVINLIYFVLRGDDEVSNIKKLLFSGYTFLWLFPIINIFGTIIIISLFISILIDKIKINKKYFKKIDKFLNIELPIRK